MNASDILTIIGVLIILLCLSTIRKVTKDKTIGVSSSDGSRLPAAKIKAVRIKRLIMPIIFLVIFIIVLAFNGPKAYNHAKSWVSTWNSKQTEETDTDNDTGTNNENPDEESQSPAEDATEGNNPEEAPEAEDASEDAGETEDGLTEEEIQANTDALRANVAASAIASTQEFTEILKSSISETPAEESDEQPETMTATDIRERVASESVLTFTTFTALLTPDTSSYVYPNMDKAELAGKYDAIINYGGITHTALTSKKMDRVKKMMAELYGFGRCGDMLGLPPETLDEWPWLYQVAGCIPVTADDLKGVNLEDDAVVKELLANEKEEVWDPRWEAMDEQQRAAQTLLATEVAILNNPVFCRAYLMHYSSIEFVYTAGKTDMDNMLKLYEDAYDLEGVDKETEPYGLLCFVEMITEEQFNNGEVWLAPVTQEYIDEIGSHVCELLLSVNYGNVGFKKLTSSHNYCLPMVSSDVLREPVEAEYQESREALIREQYNKDDLVMLRDGINRYDLRPERFPINTTVKKPPTVITVNPNMLFVEWKYESISGANVIEPHISWPKTGEDFRLLSPKLDGYKTSIDLVEGYTGALNDPMIIAGTMPNNNVHIVVVYRKIQQQQQTSSTEETKTTTTEEKKEEEEKKDDEKKEDPKDGEGAKVTAASTDNAAANDQGTGGEHYETNGNPSGDGNANFSEPDLTNSATSTSTTTDTSTSTTAGTSTSTTTTSTSSTSTSTSSTSTSSTSTTYEADTSSNPDSSSTATSGTGTVSSTSTDSEDNETVIDQTVNLGTDTSNATVNVEPQ